MLPGGASNRPGDTDTATIILVLSYPKQMCKCEAKRRVLGWVWQMVVTHTSNAYPRHSKIDSGVIFPVDLNMGSRSFPRCLQASLRVQLPLLKKQAILMLPYGIYLYTLFFPIFFALLGSILASSKIQLNPKPYRITLTLSLLNPSLSRIIDAQFFPDPTTFHNASACACVKASLIQMRSPATKTLGIYI